MTVSQKLVLGAPRLSVLWLYLGSHWFAGLFPNPLPGVLGFFLLPTTLLWYSVVQRWFGGQWDLTQIVGLLIAFIIDLSPTPARHALLSSS